MTGWSGTVGGGGRRLPPGSPGNSDGASAGMTRVTRLGKDNDVMAAPAQSDSDLLEAARAGDPRAVQDLYTRHRAAALRLARSYRVGSDAEDLVNEAFERVLAALRRGGGPEGAFRPYLYVTIRHLAVEWSSRRRDEALAEVPEPVGLAAEAPAFDAADQRLVAAAFAELPDRWQAVLWQTAVEGRRPREIARALGIPANTVSVLAHRARERLREAYLQAHVREGRAVACSPHRERLGSYVRDRLTKRQHDATAAHLEVCPRCRDLVAELRDVNRMLTRAVAPVFALAAADGLGPALPGVGGAGGAVAPSGAAAGGAAAGTAASGAAVGGGASLAGVGLGIGAKVLAAVAAVAVGVAAVDATVDLGHGRGGATVEVAGESVADRGTTTEATTTEATTGAPGTTAARPAGAGSTATTGAPGTTEVGSDPTAPPSTGPGVGLDVTAGVGEGGVGLGVGADVDTGRVGLDVGADVDVAAGRDGLGVGADVSVGFGEGAGVDVGADVGVGPQQGVTLDARWRAGLLGSGTLDVDVANAGTGTLAGAQLVVELSPGAHAVSLSGTSCGPTDPTLVGVVVNLLRSLTCTLGRITGTTELRLGLLVAAPDQSATVRLEHQGRVLASTTVALGR